MKLSIHKLIRGKPQIQTDEEGRNYIIIDGRKTNPGWGWVNIDASWPDVFALITQDGCATSAELSSDNRKDANFVSRELIMVDIDSGMTIPELLENDFYNEFGAGFYVTPSHTWEHHRFRIMFRLETPLTDAARLRRVNRGLIRVFAQADVSCKDPTRLFYGTINCEACEIRDNLLTDEMVDQLSYMIELEDQEQMIQASANQEYHIELSDERRVEIIRALRGIFVGNWHDWRTVAWGLKVGGFTLNDFLYVSQGLMNSKTPAQAKGLWNDGSANGKVTMGSVIWLIRQHLGDDFMRENRSEQREQNKLKRLQERLAEKYQGELHG